MPLTWTFSLVLSHKVINEGAPTAMNCSAPLMTPSFITLGPATLTQLTLISPSPSALACFSTSLSRSISISGRKLTPYCCATLISPSSALAGMATAVSDRSSRQRLAMDIIPPESHRRYVKRRRGPFLHSLAGHEAGPTGLGPTPVAGDGAHGSAGPGNEGEVPPCSLCVSRYRPAWFYPAKPRVVPVSRAESGPPCCSRRRRRQAPPTRSV